MKKIVIGYDGSDGAKDALRLADDLRRATGAELVVSPVDEIEPYWGDFNLEQLAEDRDQYYRRMFADAAGELGGTDFIRMAGKGSAPAALEQIAEGEDAGVIVVGSSHRAGLAKVLPGSTGDRLLAGAPCPVAVAPKGYAERDDGEIRHIGVAYDGQHEASLALDAAIDLAREIAGDLRLIAVLDGPRQLSGYFTERLEEGEKRVPDGLGSSSVIREGDPAEQLADEGKNLDLLLIGSRGYGPVRRVLLGGVAHKVMQSATCPVMVVPRSAEKATHKAESHRVSDIVI